MNEKRKILKIVLLVLFIAMPLFAGGITLQYKLKPGQKWVCTLVSKNETNTMGQKSVNSQRTTIVYKVLKGKKKDWVLLKAQIKASAKDKESGMDMSRMHFSADMHKSGELRHIKVSGNPMQLPSSDMPQEMKQMMAQQGEMIGEMYKNAVFWFPELPEESLEVGDEFEVERVMAAGGSMMQAKTLYKQVFTLEDISKGLAYFSVKQRSVTKMKNNMAGKSETKTAGKGEAVFDLQSGMWLELTEKSRAKMDMGSLPGMGNISSEMKIISKYEMELD